MLGCKGLTQSPSRACWSFIDDNHTYNIMFCYFLCVHKQVPNSFHKLWQVVLQKINESWRREYNYKFIGLLLKNIWFVIFEFRILKYAFYLKKLLQQGILLVQDLIMFSEGLGESIKPINLSAYLSPCRYSSRDNIRFFSLGKKSF